MAELQIESEKEELSSLVFVYYVTGHGFGHATRVVEVILCLFVPFSLVTIDLKLAYSSIHSLCETLIL